MSDPVEYQQYDHLLVRFTPRPTYKGSPLKKFLHQFTGQEVFVQVMWLMDEDDRYPGEYALGPMYGRHRDTGIFGDHGEESIGWIASGDVEVIRHATKEEMNEMRRELGLPERD
jgi:hypothetical protein